MANSFCAAITPASPRKLARTTSTRRNATSRGSLPLATALLRARGTAAAWSAPIMRMQLRWRTRARVL
jgi:hypothetical protein